MNINYLPLILSLLLTSAVGVYAWRHRQTPGITTFVYACLVEASWIVGYIFELSSPGLDAKIFWDNFQFIGSMFEPLLLLIFAFEYTGREKSLSRSVRIILTAFPILFMALLYTNSIHGLARTTAWIVPGRPFDALLYDFTVPMWISFIYSYLTYIAATILFVINLFRQHRLFRSQTLVILLGYVFPFLGSIPGMAGIIIFGQRDITPYTFGIGNLIFAWGLFRYGLFEIAPIARDAVMEFMNDVAIVVDIQSRVVDANPAALYGLELEINQIIGLPISQLFADRPDLIELFQQAEPVKEDVIYISPTGKEFILDAFVSPLRDHKNRIIGRLLVARDITDQRQVEAELRKAYDELEDRVQLRTAELEQANLELEGKNAELERFTYSVSHDLKSPLVTISGYLGYLEGSAAAGDMERVRSDTQRIANAVDRMYKLLSDLLEISRIGRTATLLQNISFDDLIRDALENVHGRLEARGIKVQSQPNLPFVYGDGPRLIEVLQNLLENAAKFLGDQPNPVIEIGVNGEAEGKPVFFVRDNGIGIAPEYHEQIFGLFNRLNAQAEGTGVGLALVKRIIEFHGGRIWIESEVGKGSTFYFTFQGNLGE